MLTVHEGTQSMVCLHDVNDKVISSSFCEIHTGGKDLEEIELLHLDGHKGSKPVRFVAPIMFVTVLV